MLPADWRLRQRVLDAARAAFDRRGFGRISTPTFEDTAVFARGVGESSDIVRKEMYTFADRSDRSLTLRPEGTAPVVRAFVEHGMHREPLPVKVWYALPMFRYEAPQKGRYREHTQIGAEIIGAADPAADAELIAMLYDLYSGLGVPGLRLRLNSIGDSACRPAHRELLVAFLGRRRSELCAECHERMETNPLRVFDCKNPACKAVLVDAPKLADHLCGSCAEHFAGVRAMLDRAGVPSERDDSLVRGFDYYTRTTFEYTSAGLGAQDAIGGGGRYDGLVELFGGPPTPAVGFGCGIERLMLAAAAAGGGDAEPARVDVYVCVDDDSRAIESFELAERLRARGLVVERELAGRSLKGQLKQASRVHARVAAICESDGIRLHSMEGREETRTNYAHALEETCTWLSHRSGTERTSAATSV